MLTVKELMAPRYKALKSLRVKDNGVVFTLEAGDISNVEDRYLDKFPPGTVKKLQWWECREPQDMPQIVEDKTICQDRQHKRRFAVKVPFTNPERSKFKLGEILTGTGWDFIAPIENYVPVDSHAVSCAYGGRGTGKTVFIKQILKDHTYDTLRGGFRQEPGIRYPIGYFSFDAGRVLLPDNYPRTVEDIYSKTIPFLDRLRTANKKLCPPLKAPACSVKPQIHVLNISTAVGELCSHILHRNAADPNCVTHKHDVADSIGDIAILLDSLSQRMGLSFQECIQIRFNRQSLKQGNNDPI